MLLYAVSLITMLVPGFILLADAGAAQGPAENGDEPVLSGEDFIAVKNPVLLPPRLLAERIPLGIPGDYKPCIAKLPSEELLLVMFYPHHLEDGRYQEDIILYRSDDGGVTWSERQVLDLLGREPYLIVLDDGTVFITVHFLSQDWRNTEGYIYSYLYRSTDAGRTWSTTAIRAEDVPGLESKKWVHTSRNLLELKDGSLIFGVSALGGIDQLWRSYDKGASWDKSVECQFEGLDKSKPTCPFWAETFFSAGQNDKIYGIFRVDPKVFPPLTGTQAPTEQSDQVERMIVYTPTDAGQTWGNRQDLGYYGEMYPSILCLHSGRLLLTFTVRALRPPLGVRAVLGAEDADGLHFDFEHDRLLIDTKTPVGTYQGGGFGPTVQLDDGILVTSYSYRGQDGQTHVEVVRWRLPVPDDETD